MFKKFLKKKEIKKPVEIEKENKKNYEDELLIGILSFRHKTKNLDHYRKEIEEIILPYEEKYKEQIEK